MKLSLLLSYFLVGSTLFAQDTIKIQKDIRYDKNCLLVVCIKEKCFTDSISKNFFDENNNIELRMNNECTINKKFDVFVSSFEVSSGNNTKKYSSAQSSFFTDPQKKIAQKVKLNDTLIVRNITVHAPDGFRKMDDLKMVITE